MHTHRCTYSIQCSDKIHFPQLRIKCGVAKSCLSTHTALQVPMTSVPQIRSPFCNLSLSTKRRGGLYAGCNDFSRDYAPLPVPRKHDFIVSGE